jgi:hypothetical protein
MKKQDILGLAPGSRRSAGLLGHHFLAHPGGSRSAYILFHLQWGKGVRTRATFATFILYQVRRICAGRLLCSK